jgi:hypothetical protein
MQPVKVENFTPPCFLLRVSWLFNERRKTNLSFVLAWYLNYN